MDGNIGSMYQHHRAARSNSISIVTQGSQTTVPELPLSPLGAPTMSKRAIQSNVSITTAVSPLEIESSPTAKSGLKKLLELPVSPFSPTVQPGTCRCFICWEASKNVEDFVNPCQCKNDQLKYAHRSCIDQWVNETKNLKCSVCCSKYRMTLTPVSIQALIQRNKVLVISFVVQVTLPILIYGFLYWEGSLEKMNKLLIACHLILLFIFYALFAVQMLGSIDRYRRSVQNVDDRRNA